MFNNISSALEFVKSSSYLLIFILMIIEGPLITTASALAASMGYLNIYLIIIMSLFGDITGDVIHYYVGHYFRKKIIEGYVKNKGIKESSIKKLEGKIHNNLWKSVFLIKITPPLSTPGLLLVGASRLNFSRFILVSIITTLPLTIFYTTLGYYFGFAIKGVLNYLSMGEYILFFIILFLGMSYFLYKYMYKQITKRLGV